MDKRIPALVVNRLDDVQNLENQRINKLFEDMIKSVIDEIHTNQGFLSFADESSHLQNILLLLNGGIDKDHLYNILSHLTAHFGFIIIDGNIIVIICNYDSVGGVELFTWNTFKLSFADYNVRLKLDELESIIDLISLFETYYIGCNGISKYTGITANPSFNNEKTIGGKCDKLSATVSRLLNITPRYKDTNHYDKSDPNPMLLGYIKSLMGGGSHICYNYLINWFRNLALNPYKQTKTCPIFNGSMSNSLFVETFTKCIYYDTYIGISNIDSISGINNMDILGKCFVICDETYKDTIRESDICKLHDMVIDNRAIINWKVSIDIITCLNFCIISNSIDSKVLGNREFPVFTFCEDYDNMEEINDLISDPNEMRKFISWLKDVDPVECIKMSYEHVIINEETEYWNSLSFDDIIDMLEIDQLSTESKRYGYRIDFKNIYDNYVLLCNSYNQHPMNKTSFYNNLRILYADSMNKEFVHDLGGSHKSVLIRRKQLQQ